MIERDIKKRQFLPKGESARDIVKTCCFEYWITFWENKKRRRRRGTSSGWLIENREEEGNNDILSRLCRVVKIPWRWRQLHGPPGWRRPMRVRPWRPGGVGCVHNGPADPPRSRATPYAGPARPPDRSTQRGERERKKERIIMTLQKAKKGKVNWRWNTQHAQIYVYYSEIAWNVHVTGTGRGSNEPKEFRGRRLEAVDPSSARARARQSCYVIKEKKRFRQKTQGRPPPLVYSALENCSTHYQNMHRVIYVRLMFF